MDENENPKHDESEDVPAAAVDLMAALKASLERAKLKRTKSVRDEASL